MQTEQANLYEQAFEGFLTENKIPFIWVDQSKRPEFCEPSIKNFDFLLYPDSESPVLIELKGRTFKGDSLAGLKGLDGWATFEDVQALSQWLAQFRRDFPAAGGLGLSGRLSGRGFSTRQVTEAGPSRKHEGHHPAGP